MELALTHPSSTAQGGPSNQRLEFLGDSVLGFAVVDALYGQYPDAPEGILSQLKSLFASNNRLAAVAQRLDLSRSMRVGPGFDWNRAGEKPLADTLEALVAAIYLDGGMEAARLFVEREILRDEESVAAEFSKYRLDSKSALQAWLQARRLGLPKYVMVSETGPSNLRLYRVEARGAGCIASGEAYRKRAAEQRAACKLFRMLSSGESASGQTAGGWRRLAGRMNAAMRSVFKWFGLACLVALPAAGTVDIEASSSAARKFQQLAEGSLESGDSVVLLEDEMNAFLQFHAEAAIPEGVRDPALTFRDGGAVLQARVDLESARGSADNIPYLMRLLLRGERAVSVDVDYSASEGFATAEVVSITIEGMEFRGPVLAWFIDSFAPSELQPYVSGGKTKLGGGVQSIRLEPGRAVIVAE